MELAIHPENDISRSRRIRNVKDLQQDRIGIANYMYSELEFNN